MTPSQTLEELLALHSETEWIEYKVNNSKPQEIGEYISALSNSANYHDREKAYLVYGVEDGTYNVIGTDFKPRQEKIGSQELENWLATQLSPAIDFTINEFSHEGTRIIMFIIDATRHMPVSFKGKPFIRIGSYKKSLDDHPERERKIWNNANRYTFEKVIALEDVGDDRVLDLLDHANYLTLSSQAVPYSKKGILDRLIQDKFIVPCANDSETYSITNLGAILLAKRLNDFESISRKAIRVVVYQGIDRVKTQKEQTGIRGYISGFEGLIDFVNSQLPVNEDIGVAFRSDMPVYPPLAIRELIANAIIHQNFDIGGSSPMIEIFENRIEITNPGKPLISTLRFIDPSPQSRNELLARTMRRTKICEERGSGIDKVIFECEFHQLPAPNFIEGDNYTRIIMYGLKTLRQMDKQDKIRACYQHCALKSVSGEFMTNQSLRERFGIDEKNYSTVSRIISDSIDAEFIRLYDEDNRAKRYTKYVPWWF